jgi:scyllo-inositol 2-dehydrogenase (NADP+)
VSLNVGIIGYGGMGRHHRKQITPDTGLDITGIYDINPEKTASVGTKGIKIYSSAEEMLGDTGIDVVLIATPNNFHRDYVIAALKAGKHVICEKPVALDSAELEEMIDVSRRTGRIFSVHQNRRWDKDFCIVKKVIEDGLIGTPFYIESRVQGSNGVPGDWRCVKEAGGGMLLDWGVHLIDQLLYMVNSPVVSVFAHLLSVRFKEVDDNFKVLLRFENGLSALVQVDTYCLEPLPRWHVSGDAGTLQVNGWDCDGSVTRVKESTMKWEPGIVYTAAGPTRTMAPRPVESIEKLPLPQIETDEKDYYRNFAEVVAGIGTLKVKPEECLRVMNVIDSVFVSEEKGIAVKCHID